MFASLFALRNSLWYARLPVGGLAELCSTLSHIPCASADFLCSILRHSLPPLSWTRRQSHPFFGRIQIVTGVGHCLKPLKPEDLKGGIHLHVRGGKYLDKIYPSRSYVVAFDGGSERRLSPDRKSAHDPSHSGREDPRSKYSGGSSGSIEEFPGHNDNQWSRRACQRFSKSLRFCRAQSIDRHLKNEQLSLRPSVQRETSCC
ncbi:uncharacterized protein J3D65DRAFT_76272 [Phyllosticta citribraziliensis]|uniref:Uncharacterized protein n=1 Tax=Phyllosticta citribraziliensis TaxID=989973 RepID=A0ABR1LF49_9PEZI